METKKSLKKRPFDYKKDMKELYSSGKRPEIVEVPKANFLMVRGKGDPNEPEGEYKKALNGLYTISYTLRMSLKAGHEIPGFYEYVVPPLEGLWWQSGGNDLDLSDKASLEWIAMIRVPDFIDENAFEWAKDQARKKKGSDFSFVTYGEYDEGKCAQCLHIGPYDAEGETIEALKEFIRESGCKADESRSHHEIYLGDPRRAKPENLKTIIRIPIEELS